MKIKIINDTGIVFDNGSTISHKHEQDCCENNYADYKQLEDQTGVFEDDFDLQDTSAIQILEHKGFNLISKSGNRYFIPCYSEQDGYYSSDITLVVKLLIHYGIDCNLVY